MTEDTLPVRKSVKDTFGNYPFDLKNVSLEPFVS